MGREGQEPWGSGGGCQQGRPGQGPSEEAKGGCPGTAENRDAGEARAAGNAGDTHSLGSVADRCQSRDTSRPFSSRYWAAIEGCTVWAGPDQRPGGGLEELQGQLEGSPSHPHPSKVRPGADVPSGPSQTLQARAEGNHAAHRQLSTTREGSGGLEGPPLGSADHGPLPTAPPPSSPRLLSPFAFSSLWPKGLRELRSPREGGPGQRALGWGQEPAPDTGALGAPRPTLPPSSESKASPAAQQQRREVPVGSRPLPCRPGLPLGEGEPPWQASLLATRWGPGGPFRGKGIKSCLITFVFSLTFASLLMQRAPLRGLHLRVE